MTTSKNRSWRSSLIVLIPKPLRSSKEVASNRLSVEESNSTGTEQYDKSMLKVDSTIPDDQNLHERQIQLRKQADQYALMSASIPVSPIPENEADLERAILRARYHHDACSAMDNAIEIEVQRRFELFRVMRNESYDAKINLEDATRHLGMLLDLARVMGYQHLRDDDRLDQFYETHI